MNKSNVRRKGFTWLTCSYCGLLLRLREIRAVVPKAEPMEDCYSLARSPCSHPSIVLIPLKTNWPVVALLTVCWDLPWQSLNMKICHMFVTGIFPIEIPYYSQMTLLWSSYQNLTITPFFILYKSWHNHRIYSCLRVIVAFFVISPWMVIAFK